MVKPTTVDEYIAALEDPAASRLRELRGLARETVPEASEALKWGSPTDLLCRMIVHRLREYEDDGVNWM